MNWAPTVQLLITGFVAFWGVPAAWEYWSRERRLAARIERNAKVLAANDLLVVEQVLREDVRVTALQLASIRANPVRARDIRWLVFIAGMSTTLWLGPLWPVPSSKALNVACGAGIAILILVGAPRWRAVWEVRQRRQQFNTEHSRTEING